MPDKKILVVDDEPDVLLLCRVNLEYQGYEIIEAQDGLEALEAASEHVPDLILLDVMMSGMDGWQVLNRLKSDPATADIPVIMLTAKVTERDQITGLSAGAIDYVTKPFNPATLSKTVKHALDPQGKASMTRRRDQNLEKLRVVDHGN